MPKKSLDVPWGKTAQKGMQPGDSKKQRPVLNSEDKENQASNVFSSWKTVAATQAAWQVYLHIEPPITLQLFAMTLCPSR